MTQIQKFDTLIRDALSGRVGLVFPVGQEPEDASGTLPHPVPKDGKWAKYYLPAEGEFAKMNFTVYTVPAGVAHAPHGEIIFRKHAEATVIFARFDEVKAWGFGKEPYMRLRVNRNPDGGYDSFVPLYIRVNQGGDVSYYRLEVQWGKDIAVYIDEMKERSVPAHLVKGSTRQ